MPNFPVQAPLFSHPSGAMLPSSPAPGPKAVPPVLDIPIVPRALSSGATAKPVNIAAIGTPAGPGVTYYATSAPMPSGNGEVALGAAAPAITSPGYPTASGRPTEKAVNEAPGQSHRSEKLMQELMERHPGCPRQQEHKLPARAPQQPKPRLVLTALRTSQSAKSQPQPPLLWHRRRRLEPASTSQGSHGVATPPSAAFAWTTRMVTDRRFAHCAIPAFPRKVPAKMVQDGPLLFGTCYGKGFGG
nr:predicted GPI-anchored protein 58 [Rhipicephalus microplus]